MVGRGNIFDRLEIKILLLLPHTGRGIRRTNCSCWSCRTRGVSVCTF
jgi:hypothetical protein